jgi:hypothetical protein
MTHLDLSGLQVGAQHGAHFLDRGKGGHPERLVDAEYFAFYRVEHLFFCAFGLTLRREDAKFYLFGIRHLIFVI